MVWSYCRSRYDQCRQEWWQYSQILGSWDKRVEHENGTGVAGSEINLRLSRCDHYHDDQDDLKDGNSDGMIITMITMILKIAMVMIMIIYWWLARYDLGRQILCKVQSSATTVGKIYVCLDWYWFSVSSILVSFIHLMFVQYPFYSFYLNFPDSDGFSTSNDGRCFAKRAHNVAGWVKTSERIFAHYRKCNNKCYRKKVMHIKRKL